jgi:hypothetical protein
MATRTIENRRADGGNLQKNRLTPVQAQQQYSFPPHIAQSTEDRDAIVAALDVFIQCCVDEFELPGRNWVNDNKLLGVAIRVRSRITG